MKRLLLDTHTFIWWETDSPALGPVARSIIADCSKQVYVSAVTPWEISMKRKLGKLIFELNVEESLLEDHFLPLPITLAHTEHAGMLPLHHSDPFDRMLIAQSQLEGLALLSADSAFQQYGVYCINARL